MQTIAFSLSPTRTIQLLLSLSIIDGLWTLSESGLRLSKYGSTWSENMVRLMDGPTFTTLFLDIRPAAGGHGPGVIDAARLVILSRTFGAEASFIIVPSKLAVRAISLAMS